MTCWKSIAAIIGLVVTFIIIMNIVAFLLGFGGIIKYAYDHNPEFRAAWEQLKAILSMLKNALFGLWGGLKVGE